ncbi:hypothetical protein DXG01_012398 [Tephrocybe rancida]|nr:hypothetical protein DXG01_012398 [Tephrocybe rancida]
MDLEAEEDYRDEEDILLDEDDDLDNFLTDKVFWDDEGTAGPQQISRQLAASTISDLEWEGLSEDDNSEEDDDDLHCLERMGLAKLWRVVVKEGYEETAPIVLFNKILKAGWTSVTSIFRRISCPGWIFIEADSISEAQKVCQDVSDVYVQQLYPIPPEQAGQYLLEPPLFIPHPGSFVCLDSPPLYCSDLAYVLDYNYRGEDHLCENCAGARASVLVVPRIELFMNREVCVDQALHSSWKNIQFEHGFLSLDLHDVEPTVMTHKELKFFKHVDVIPTQALAAAEEEITKSLLWEGNLIMVHWGEMRGRVGRITQVDVDVNEALLPYLDQKLKVKVRVHNTKPVLDNQASGTAISRG